MNVKLSKLLVLAGFAVIAVVASGCSDAKKTPVPPPPPGGGNGPVTRPGQRPNLRVTRFDAQVRVNGTVRCTVEVSNTGLATTGRPTTVSIRRIPEGGRAEELVSAQVPELLPGQASVPITVSIAANRLKVSKSIMLCAYADHREEVKEGTDGELDNHTDQTIVYGPDVVVRSVVNQNPDDPTKLQLKARVSNIGTIDSPPVRYQWAYQIVDPNAPKDAKPEDKWRQIESNQVASTRPGAPPQEILFTFPPTTGNELAGKSITVSLFLDRERRVEELDNTNNSAGVGHTFPPIKPDLNVWGLMSWWNRAEAKLYFHSFITNTGNGAVPGGKFESQWFREPGTNNAVANGANATGGSGTNEGWEAMSDVLMHDAAETQRPWRFANWEKKNPEFVYVPETKEEGQVLALRYEVDPYNEIIEETDPQPGTAGAPGSNVTVPANGQTAPAGGKAKKGEKVRLGRNGPNNSFIWNFQVPRFQQPNLRIVAVQPTVSDDRERLSLQVNVGNYGTIGAGKFKIIATLDGQTKTHEIPNMPPGYMNVGWPFRFEFTRAQRKAGNANLTVRVEPSRKNRTEDALNATRKIVLPDEKIGAQVMFTYGEIELQKQRRDPLRPDRYDTVMVYYRIINTGDRPSGNLKISGSIEGGPGFTLDNKEGIAPGNVYVNTYMLDITKMGQPYKKTPIKLTMSVDAENDQDKTDNQLVFSETSIPATEPLLPDLIISEIRGASKNNNAVGTYRMHCTVANIGQAAAPNFWVKWWVNDKPASRGMVGSLAPQASTDRYDGNICEYKLQPKDKLLKVRVIVDPDYQVPEENGLNNMKDAEFDKDEFFDNPAPAKIDVPDPSKAEKDGDDPEA